MGFVHCAEGGGVLEGYVVVMPPIPAPAFALLITGPAGAGKTAVARAWAESRPRTSAHLSLDDVREFVRAGYANPQAGWNDDCRQQYALARRGCAILARLYNEAGMQCVIDDAIFPAWDEVSYVGWTRDLGGTPHRLVVLLPRWERVIERNALRGGHRRLAEDMLWTIYQMMAPWREQERIPVIDTSDFTVAETVAAIDAALSAPPRQG